MSRGLGKLQREILDALPEAKNRVEYYKGRSSCNGGIEYIHIYGWDVVLADDVYDLRETLKYLAQQKGEVQACGSYTKESFQASFSRAVKGLVKRGYLKELRLVPLKSCDGEIDPDGNTLVIRLSDGLYINMPVTNQIRFVRFAENGKNS